jgi:DNA-binding NarL/FixJ family response regulator
MQPNIQNDKVTSIWIVSKHPLVARYLLAVLARDPQVRPNWVQATIPTQNELGTYPVFVFDNSALDVPVARYVQNLNQISEAKFIVLGNRLEVHSVCQLLCLGIHGFLTYDQVNESLLLAVRAVQSGGMWVDSRVLQKYMRLTKRDKDSLTSPADDGLTAREEEILHFTQQRLSNKEIASLLNIEVSTVKFHLSNIFSKLQIASRSDLWQNSMPRVAMLPFAKHGRSATAMDKGTEFRADAN